MPENSMIYSDSQSRWIYESSIFMITKVKSFSIIPLKQHNFLTDCWIIRAWCRHWACLTYRAMTRKLSIALLIAVCAVSCERPHHDAIPRYLRMQDRFSAQAGRGGHRDSTTQVTPPSPELPDVYAAAFHFEDSLHCRALLFKNGELYIGVPVKSPPDPERVRIRDGHLWTDETDGFKTTIYCDGKEMFRFDGEEQMRGFLLADGKLHTLGQKPGKAGFTYRIDGEAVFSSADGTVIGGPGDPEWDGGALAADGNEVCFAFSRPVKANREYTVVRGGEPIVSFAPGATERLMDIRVKGATVYRAEKTGYVIHFIAGNNDLELHANIPNLSSCRIGWEGDELTLRLESQLTATSRVFWHLDLPSALLKPTVSAESARSMLVSHDGQWLLVNALNDGRLLLSLDGEDLAEPIDGYYIQSPSCLFLDGKGWAAALSSQGRAEHLIMSSRGNYTASFNGYFIEVRME